MTTKHLEHRYEEVGGAGTLHTWGVTPIKRTSGVQPIRNLEATTKDTQKFYTVEERPDWLVRIVDMARIGGHLNSLPRVHEGDPLGFFLWFVTNPDHELIAFSDSTGQLALDFGGHDGS